MTESSGYESYRKLIIRGAVVFLISVSLVTSFRLASSEGLTPAVIGEIAVGLYVSALVFYGVFCEAMDSKRFRLALAVGVVFWGGQRFISGDDSVLTVGLLLGGMGMMLREHYFKSAATSES